MRATDDIIAIQQLLAAYVFAIDARAVLVGTRHVDQRLRVRHRHNIVSGDLANLVDRVEDLVELARIALQLHIGESDPGELCKSSHRLGGQGIPSFRSHRAILCGRQSSPEHALV